MELDNRMKQLLRELGRAINQAVTESDEIAHAIARLKTHGYDVFLMLDAVVGLNRRKPNAPPSMTNQDRRFLKSLKIRIDEESAEAAAEGRLTITPQDIKECNYEPEESQPFVEIGLSLKGVLMSIFIRQHKPGKVKFSLRSKIDAIDVNKFAAPFGGGGHAKAAGLVSDGTFDEASQRIVQAAEAHMRQNLAGQG